MRGEREWRWNERGGEEVEDCEILHTLIARLKNDLDTAQCVIQHVGPLHVKFSLDRNGSTTAVNTGTDHVYHICSFNPLTYIT